MLEGGLDQAVTLAASMDARGYGRIGAVSASHRRSASVCLLGGVVATGLGLLGLLGLTLPAGIAFALLVVGLGAGAAGLVLGGRGRSRSRYRRLEFGLAELLVLLSAAGPGRGLPRRRHGRDTWAAAVRTRALARSRTAVDRLPARAHSGAGHPRDAPPMITFENVTVRYADDGPAAVAAIDLVVDEGELCLLAGTTGSGKSTVLAAVNGLVPHFTGGTFSGRVVTDGRDTAHHRPRDLADVVGYVGQNPSASFVTSSVTDELAYTMESLGLPRRAMRRRIEDTLDLLGHRRPA